MVLPWPMPKSSALSLIFLVSPPQLVFESDAVLGDHVPAVPDGAGVVDGAEEAVVGVSLMGNVGAPPALLVLLVPDPGMPCHCSTGGISPITPIWLVGSAE